MFKQLWIALTNRNVVGQPDTAPSPRLNMTGRPAVEAGRCTACGACADACPTGALRKGSPVPGFAPGRCLGCARCVEACTPACLAFAPVSDTWALGAADEWQPLRTREVK
ncbi:MAG TPA: 4Fe-4S binding protein [Candidatus Ozemobacteraceae bacterium]|nr:4Fe-4S binding protein [Candidatus Ozemobacteraceae bacterium]